MFRTHLTLVYFFFKEKRIDPTEGMLEKGLFTNFIGR